MTATILSLGMGVESVAILARWMLEPATRPCPIEELIVLTAQTGDEFASTGYAMETYMLPLMRQHHVRYVQVARRGPTEADGYTVLDDSRSPQRMYLEGDYKLSDELKRSGVVPAYTSTHICSLHAKVQPLEAWIADHLTHANTIRHAFGYNVEEPKRVATCEAATVQRIAFGFNVDEAKRTSRAKEHDSALRESFFPLVEWNWNRQDCLDYLQSTFSYRWEKSCCAYCCFSALNEETLARQRRHPEQVADGMMIELAALSMNPRSTLYPNKSLIQITLASGDLAAAEAYDQRLAATDWSLYRVRRVYQAGKRDGVIDPTKKGIVDRAVEKLTTYTTRADAEADLDRMAETVGGEFATQWDIRYLYLIRRGEEYPAKEEFYVVAPSVIESKSRYGMEWFEAKRWDAPHQGELFPTHACC